MGWPVEPVSGAGREQPCAVGLVSYPLFLWRPLTYGGHFFLAREPSVPSGRPVCGRRYGPSYRSRSTTGCNWCGLTVSQSIRNPGDADLRPEHYGDTVAGDPRTMRGQLG
jgi:hypothetical protein